MMKTDEEEGWKEKDNGKRKGERRKMEEKKGEGQR